MKCLNCGGVSVIWRPEIESLWCTECHTEPRGMEIPQEELVWE